MVSKIKRLLIANRGEIACRIIKTARKMSITTIMIYSDADKNTLAVKMADEAIYIGASQASESYLNIEKIITICKQYKVDAVHPGYGFLSENAHFAKCLAKENIIFIGPPVSAIDAMGDKITSKKIADNASVSTVPGYLGIIDNVDAARKIASDIGYPVMVKASAGGGGKGMRIAYNDNELEQAFISSANEARNSFGDDRLFIEKFIENPRHIEIQILGDHHGHIIHLNERECSIQRRNQKVIEEAPSSFLTDKTRDKMTSQALALAQKVGYFSAGTVEFIVDKDQNFYFLEMNTRLQVEHPVTELIHHIDLVEWMIKIANGEKLTIQQSDIVVDGWAIESRIYAEDPFRGFLPSTGRLKNYLPPHEGCARDGSIIRNDTGVEDGGNISMYYDPMIAKLCSWGKDRYHAITAQARALDKFIIDGIGHNIPFLSSVMAHDKFISGDISTAFIAQEYGERFSGSYLSENDHLMLIYASVAAHYISDKRYHIQQDDSKKSFFVKSDKQHYHINIDHKQDYFIVTSDDTNEASFSLDWQPGKLLAYYTDNDGHVNIIKLRMVGHSIYHIEYRGYINTIRIYPSHIADYFQYMPEISDDMLDNKLYCPMPCLLTALHVKAGDIVESGQALATIEAMKMENILYSPQKQKIKSIIATQGKSLMVNDVIMEFDNIEFNSRDGDNHAPS